SGSAARRERVSLGPRQLDAGGCVGDRGEVENRRLRGASHAAPRPMGRGRRRCGPHLPQYERVGAARGCRADRVFRAQSESASHARKLRPPPPPQSPSHPHFPRPPPPPTPATIRAYQCGILRGDGTLARSTGVCAPVVYRGDRLPADLYGNVFVAEPAANLVSRIIVSDDGTTLRARKAYERGEFLASTD